MHLDRLAAELTALGEKDISFRASDFWMEKLRDLVQLAKTGDPRQFLQWDIIRSTMHGGNRETINQHYFDLLELPDFRQRWEKGIRESMTGNPTPFCFDRNSSPILIQHNYHLAIYERIFKTHITDVDVVYEIGGGYGSMLRLFYQLGFQGKYVIYDTPPFSVLQKLYLSDLGINVTSGEVEEWRQAWCIHEPKHIRQFENDLKKNRAGKTLFMATWSLSEMDMEDRDIIVPDLSLFSHFLIAFQDEMSGVDNLKYFNEFTMRSPEDIEWKSMKIDDKSYYAFGRRVERRET
jgi:hypothetical protein